MCSCAWGHSPKRLSSWQGGLLQPQLTLRFALHPLNHSTSNQAALSFPSCHHTCIANGSLFFNYTHSELTIFGQLPSDPSELCGFGIDLEAKSVAELSTQTLEPRSLGLEGLPRPSQNKRTLSGPMDLLQDVEKKTLWTPQDALLKNKAQISNLASPVTSASLMQIEAEVRQILQERWVEQQWLCAESVKYAGFGMAEDKCIEVDNKQATVSQADTGNPPKLGKEQCQALIALDGTLLNEHDLFLASQYDVFSLALQCLAIKNAMAARKWRYGSHSFLELLRHRLPASLDHMRAYAFTYSYSGCGQKPLTRVCSQVLKLYDKTYGTLLQAIKSSWAWNPFAVFPKHKHHFSIGTIISFILFQGSVAAPLDRDVSGAQPNGFGTYWDNQYRHFTEEYSGPLLMNSAWGILLTTLYFIITYCDRGRWKETDLLLIATSILSGGSFFLGMSEWLSYWQLSFLWLLNASLNAQFIQQKLTEFPRSGQLTAFAIGSLGFALAGILAFSMTASDGPYENSWILAAMLVLPITVFLAISWLVLLRNTGIARYLEDGGYNAPVEELIAATWKPILSSMSYTDW
ncbi:hypothetical protein HYFRA_00009540 [Hymenoscyphus fraxineus]|uniref:Uncharacterized protein n=1 Tax=Hymenoscyphus fraxineus TaxID=746836 RepID=A0A9N9KX86_9HELO|nr:hypothetical protein HYFRA_00009540 [Hymenoscyphus fraxineus]